MAEEHLFQQTFEIKGGDFNGAGRASGGLRGILKQIGVSAAVIRRVAVAAHEAEINVVIYARRGRLSFVITPRKVTVVVEDEGEGIPDVDLAMQEGYSTASSEIREMQRHMTPQAIQRWGQIQATVDEDHGRLSRHIRDHD